MADKELGSLASATTLDGTETHYVVQGGNSRKTTGAAIVAITHNQAWSTITSTPTTLSGYGITDAQPLDSDLTAIAALTTTGFGRGFLEFADEAAFKAGVNLEIGTDVQAHDALLDAIAALTTASGDIVYATGVDAVAALGIGVSGQVLKVGATGLPEWGAAAGGGDMLASVYDPTSVAGDAFDMANMVEATDAKIMTAAERTKLTGIEAGADVTDATNVDAAGATMNTDTDVSGNSWVNSAGPLANSTGTVAAENVVKTFVDALGLPALAPADATKQLFATTAGNGYTLLKTFVHAGLYGVVGDAAKRLATVTISSGGTSLSANPIVGQVSFAFSPSDVGKCIVIEGAGASGGNLLTTIASYTSATEVELSDAASTAIAATSKTICYGTDNLQPLQDCLDAISPVGACLFIPTGEYLSSGTASKTLQAGGAAGKGVSIFGASRSNTTIYSAVDGQFALEILGPAGTFASHFVIEGLRFAGAVSRKGHGLKACGLSHSRFDCYFDNCDSGIQLEAVLISEFDSKFYQCNIGARSHKFGYFGGTWGDSGCNANVWRGAFNACIQYAADFYTFQGVLITAHCERNGANDIANGGVANTDRGGFKFVDPEGLIHISSSFEDNGTIDGSNIGFGPIEVVTTAANAGINWTLLFDGYIKRTMDVFRSAIYVNQHASAGYGHVVWNGHLENISGYTASTSRPTISRDGTAENLAVTMLGGHIDGGDIEFTYYSNVRYTILGTSGIKMPTLATLPNASANSGRRLWVSDLGGSAGYVVSDGTKWRREQENGAAQTYATDGPIVLTPLSSAPELLYAATQTTTRTVTLSATNAYEGATFYIAKTTADGMTLNVSDGTSTLKALTSGQYCIVKFIGGVWFLMHSGAR